jgi:mannose-6-phosphate isomerase-like protein (cupin superfamily)
MYGIDVEHLGELMYVAPVDHDRSRTLLTARAEYSLEQLNLQTGDEHEISTTPGEAATVFVEEGAVEGCGSDRNLPKLVNIAPGSKVRLRGCSGDTGYVFRGPAGAESQKSACGETYDLRSKYWGSIETIVNAGYTGKRLFFRKGKHSSLHFHCAKMETYYVHSGCLLVRLRAGRGEDRWFPLGAGTILNIPPGLMHQSGALEDTVIMEVSTHDEDADSFLVEDGERFPMPRLKAMVAQAPAGRKSIVFDLDGCLCRQTEGDYENAQPIARAISLVNRLYDGGHEITIHTSRYMGRCAGNVARAYYEGFEFTQQQLRAWGVRYHLLAMGKPAADLVVDDRALFFRSDWEQIGEEIELHLGLHPLSISSHAAALQGAR